MNYQRTLKKELTCQSVGLHSGRKVNMIIKPAEADEGIILVRMDLSHKPTIRVCPENVTDTTLATTIGSGGATVSTVEHILSALSGMGVDNAVIEVDAPEIPIMDGSAQPFVTQLKQAGIRTQNKLKKYLVVKRRVAVAEGDGFAVLEPATSFAISYKIQFAHPAIGEQSYHLELSEETYEREICRARTFGFIKDVEYLQAKGLALGGSLKNAVILDEKRIINKEGLRCPDEFVKHKILDAIGDLSLTGLPIMGHFLAFKSGHKLNSMLVKALLEQRENWTIANFEDCRDLREVFRPLRQPARGMAGAVHA